jgi:hypothetical protein
MYSAIFGFQRRVWCPKWTPASSSCFMDTTAMFVFLLGFSATHAHVRGSQAVYSGPPALESGVCVVCRQQKPGFSAALIVYHNAAENTRVFAAFLRGFDVFGIVCPKPCVLTFPAGPSAANPGESRRID